MMETFRNLWLNWGWQYPVWSSLVVAFLSVGLWWIFGGVIYLSDPSRHKSGTEAAQTSPTSVSTSASPASKTPSVAVNADGMKLPGRETNESRTKAVKSDVSNAEIYSFFSKGDTSLKVSRALEPYVGTVMTIEGKLIQIHGGSGGPIALSMFVNNGPGASCVFDGEWLDHLDALKRDQQITVRGKIRPEPSGNDLQLIECELLASKPAATPSPTAKSALDRIKIRDTPDGAIIGVESLEEEPTATPSMTPETGPRNVPPKKSSALPHDPSPKVVPPKDSTAATGSVDDREKQIRNCLSEAIRYTNIRPGIWSLWAIHLSGARKLGDNDAVIDLCNRLTRYGCLPPFEFLEDHIPEKDRLEFLQTASGETLDILALARRWGIIKGTSTVEKPIPIQLRMRLAII